MKRVQNDAYNKHKFELSDADLLVNVDFAESYRDDKENEIQILLWKSKLFALYIVLLF